MTETDVANLALDHLGEAPVVSLEDVSPVARALKRHFAGTRDALLRKHRWNFCAGRAVLSPLAEGPVFGHRHAFLLPDDCLRVWDLRPAARHAVEGGRLLADVAEARLVYGRRMPDPGTWDAIFVQAFSLKLASAVAMAVSNSVEKKQVMEQLFQAVELQDALWVDALEGPARARLGSRPRGRLGLGSGLGPGSGCISFDSACGDGGGLSLPGDKGAAGEWGWSPLLAMEEDGERRVLKVVDWTGGTGSKPPHPKYLGGAGWVGSVAEALNVAIKGEQGLAGTMTIGSVTTGAPGSPVEVVNSGTAENAVLHFTIPAGLNGDGAGTVTSVAVSGSDGLEVDSGSPVTGAGTIALGVNAAGLRSHLNVADGADVTGAQIAGAAGKTTPVEADGLALSDSEAAGALKTVTVANLLGLTGSGLTGRGVYLTTNDTYLVTRADRSRLLVLDWPCTVTLDADSLAVGDTMAVRQGSTGAITFVADGPAFTGVGSGTPQPAQQGTTWLITRIRASEVPGPHYAFAAIRPLPPPLKDTLALPAGCWRTKTTGGALLTVVESGTNKLNDEAWRFEYTNRKAIQCVAPMPHDWDQGTLSFYVVWRPAGSSTLGVAWSLAAVARSDNDAADAALGSAVTVLDSYASNANVHVSGVSAALTVGGSPAAKDTILFELAREVADVGDAMNEAADVLAVHVQYGRVPVNVTWP